MLYPPVWTQALRCAAVVAVAGTLPERLAGRARAALAVAAAPAPRRGRARAHPLNITPTPLQNLPINTKYRFN